MIRLVVGDGSGAGHGHQRSFLVRGATLHELRKAYAAGVERTGVDLTKRFTTVGTWHGLELEDWQRLSACGLGHPHAPWLFEFVVPITEHEAEKCTIDPETYVVLWLFICWVGKPSLDLSLVDPPRINVGGYDLLP